MRRSLLLFFIASTGVAAVYGGIRLWPTPAHAATPAIAHKGEVVASSTPPSEHSGTPVLRATPWQLLAASEPTTVEPEAPPPEPPPPLKDDVELLDEAIADGDLEVVRAMIASGFPVNTDNSELRDPLAVARDKARDGNATAAKIVALLEEQGAIVRTREEPEIVDGREETNEPMVDDVSTVMIDGPINAPEQNARRLVYF